MNVSVVAQDDNGDVVARLLFFGCTEAAFFSVLVVSYQVRDGSIVRLSRLFHGRAKYGAREVRQFLNVSMKHTLRPNMVRARDSSHPDRGPWYEIIRLPS